MNSIYSNRTHFVQFATRFTLLAVFFIVSPVLHSQYFKSGGTGYFSSSLIFANHTGLSTALANGGISTESGYENSIAMTIGGGGSYLFANRWMISGDGFHAFYPSAQSGDVTIQRQGGGATFTANYLIINGNKWLAYPGIGIGFNGHMIEIDNQSKAMMYFGNSPIEEGSSEQFVSTLPVMDIRIGAGRLLSQKQKGFFLSLDIGYVFDFTKGNWKNSNSGEKVSGVESPSFNGFYVRLNIGGGRFKLN